MCLILFSYQNDHRYKLILAANRDEYYERPTASAQFWEDDPCILAGRDLKGGGTWLGINRNGKIAAITNYRNPSSNKGQLAPSRGLLVSDFLGNRSSPAEYRQIISKRAKEYNEFNLLFGDANDLIYFCSHNNYYKILSSGIYGLSNHMLNTPWPKVKTGCQALTQVLSQGDKFTTDELFDILTDRTIPGDDFLPDTGIGLEWERILSSIFITSPIYGTRSSTIVLVDYDNNATLIEKTYKPNYPEIFDEFTITLKLDPKNQN